MASSTFAGSASADSVPAGSRPPQEPLAHPAESVTITCDDRWQVYHRLQSLEIDCQCGGFQPLQVQIKTPTEALQLWSVLRRVSQHRLVLAAGLQQCWEMSD